MTLHIIPEPTPPTPIIEIPATQAAEQPTETPSETDSQAKTPQEETPPTQPTMPTEHDKQETEPPAPTTTEEIPPPDLPEDKASVDVYRLSATDAAKHGAMEIYDLSRRIDFDCALNISSGIQYFKDGNSYVLGTPAEILLNEYGKTRMIWVLSKHILTKLERFSKDNQTWATTVLNEGTGYGDDVPTFTIKTHPAVLDAFVTELRKFLDTAPSFSTRMKDAKMRSDVWNNSSG